MLTWGSPRSSSAGIRGADQRSVACAGGGNCQHLLHRTISPDQALLAICSALPDSQLAYPGYFLVLMLCACLHRTRDFAEDFATVCRARLQASPLFVHLWLSVHICIAACATAVQASTCLFHLLVASLWFSTCSVIST